MLQTGIGGPATEIYREKQIQQAWINDGKRKVSIAITRLDLRFITRRQNDRERERERERERKRKRCMLTC